MGGRRPGVRPQPAHPGVRTERDRIDHDDVLQWFLSPRTNRRDDGYGGDLEGRRRLVREVCEAIRGHVARPITLGLRLCLDERIEDGYGIGECAAFVAAFTADGTVDYFQKYPN
jgi:2,4-dienoyl-CoA reductase-like NADH-dependent reductase (Old Yellow Enzyme family)